MIYQYPDAVLMIFCKAPVAGRVKTRLMTALTAEQAMRVHIELAQRTLQWQATTPLTQGLKRTIAYFESLLHPEAAELAAFA